MLSLFLIHSFFDFFGFNISPESCLNTKFNSIPSNCFVSSCLFFNLNEYIVNGGVFSISNNNINLLIEHVSFVSCSCSLLGGSIYFLSTTNGNLVLNKICSLNCSASSFSFARIECISTKIFSISINKCPNDLLYQKRRVLTLYYGSQEFQNLNISNNKVYEHSGFDSYSYNIVNISFIYIYNNLVSHSVTCFFPYGKRYITNFIVLNCNSPLSWGIFAIANSANIFFENSYFYNNSNTLFGVETSSKVEISNSIIIHNINYYYGSISHLNSNNFYNFTLYSFFKPYFCNNNEKTYIKKKKLFNFINNFLIFLN